ncbi:ABC transporter permease [Stenotrophomonas lactitubi]|uniref:ABC transporter permease n=1 Tax=Stenotrophomonas lactitubi TaxID=2045214 RepID=UPI0032081BFA
MSAWRSVMRNELRGMLRDRTALSGIALLTLLALAATLVSWNHMQSAADYRARQQTAAQQAFDAQPDRHPHRVVHYGHFVYRLPSALAAFDPGVDPFTGSSMFLEGHRQNSANFGDVMQSSILTRFGQLTPAFVLQVLVPLVLIFLGHGVLAQERERGTLRQLMLQGAPARAIIIGKLAALWVMAAVFMLPACSGLLVLGVSAQGSLAVSLLLMAAYALYLGAWSMMIVAGSAVLARRRDALLALVAAWAVSTLLVPRLAPDLAHATYPLPDRLQTEVAIGRDARALGDSHDPQDPYFATFRQQVLDTYGVTRIEDLPVNYKGLLAVEGERMTSSLFNAYAARSAEAQQRQNRLVGRFALVSPSIVLSQLSMAAAQTDLAAHLHFVSQAEAYRYQMVQSLNQLQADAVSYADDTAKDAGADSRKRVDRSHWHDISRFTFRPQPVSAILTAMQSGLLTLLGWFSVGVLLLFVGARRMEAAR